MFKEKGSFMKMLNDGEQVLSVSYTHLNSLADIGQKQSSFRGQFGAGTVTL